MKIITVDNVSKEFKGEYVLTDVNVAFDKGMIHGIVGPNGSGKTMLLKAICGFIQPSAGEVVVNGKRIGKETDFPADVGLIIETPGLLPYLTAYKNLAYLAQLRGVIGKAEIEASLCRVGLEPKLNKPVGKYSQGMRQRLGIAQAIMENPSLLVLDEPMNGLDRQGIDDMRTLFKNLRQEGKTILLTSHNADDISILCDTVSEMDQGRLSFYYV